VARSGSPDDLWIFRGQFDAAWDPSPQIDRAEFQFGAKLNSRRFEIALMQVDEAHEIVCFGEMGIDLQGSPEFA